MIIAHRGIHNNKDVPENSILSYKLAMDKNYGIELDIHISKDNQLVVLHDVKFSCFIGIHTNTSFLKCYPGAYARWALC